MAGWNGKKGEQGSPPDEPRGQPRDLYPTSDIRFVITEIAKLTERIDNLIKSVDEIKSNGTDTRDRLIDLEKGVSFVKGAMWVFGGIFAIALAIFTVLFRSKFGG